MAKVLELKLQDQSFQRIFRTISFRIDCFDLLAVQGTLKSSLAPQFKSTSSSALSSLWGMQDLSAAAFSLFLSYGMWNLVLWPGTEPNPLALGTQSLSHWTTREVPKWIWFNLKKGFPGSTSVKEPTCQWRRHKSHRFKPCVGKIPWRRKLQPTPVFLFGESHGQRNLAGCNPSGRKESDMTEAT